MAESRFPVSKIRDIVSFALEPDAPSRAAIASELGIVGLKKLRFTGTLAPSGRRDVTLEADLGATVVQECVVTGAPVTTRIEEEVTRRYLSDWIEPEGDEVEMPEDDSAEPLPAVIDVEAVMAEALALALPLFPRAEGVEPVEVSVAEPGQEPMTDEDAKPFAGLRALRDDLSKRGGGDA